MWYKNVRAQNLLILTLSCIGLMGSVYFFSLKWELSPEDRHQIETTVYSSLVEYLTYHPKADFDYIFLGSSGSDPSPKILNDFHDHRPAVEPISSSRITFGFSAPVVHKSDLRKRGISIDLEIQGREADGHVKVLTSLYQDKAASGNYMYTLKKNDGVYRVISVRRPEQTIF